MRIHKGSFFIQSSERKEKLKKEFSELFEKIVDEKTSLNTDSFYKEHNIPEDNEVRLNVIETHELINLFKKEKDWNTDLSSFWGIIFLSFNKILK